MEPNHAAELPENRTLEGMLFFLLLTIVMLSFVYIHVLTTFIIPMYLTYIHIGSTSKANPFRDIFNKEIFHGIPKKTSVFIISKVILPRSHKGSDVVRRHAKGEGKLSNRWLCVVTARRGACGPRAKQIVRAGELMGTS